MTLRLATKDDASEIWEILKFAIESRRKDGSQQWQDGYPNLTSISNDIEKGSGYVLALDEEIACYCAMMINDEPAYDNIEGKWLSNGDFLVVHRVAIAPEMRGKGVVKQLFKLLEDLATAQNIFSIKVDTNFDNEPMLHILKTLGYSYCGEVFFRGAARKAFEKLLKP